MNNKLIKTESLKEGGLCERLYSGVWKENPLFVQLLGTCPTLAVTTSAMNGLGMGLSTTAVLIMSNVVISLLRRIIPQRVRLPGEIVVVATMVTICDMLMEGFTPGIYKSLGIFIPLIVVNCIILGRAEAYAMKNTVLSSAFDGLGMGLGFSIALVLIGSFRELLGNGTVFGMRIMPDSFVPASIFILAPGAFFIYAALTAIQNRLKMPCATNTGAESGREGFNCMGNCMQCELHKERQTENRVVTANPAAQSAETLSGTGNLKEKEADR